MSTTTTGPATVAALLDTFALRAREGDVDGLVALYEPDGVFQPSAGVVLRGHDQIRAALTELLSLQPQIRYHGDHEVVDIDGLALVSSHWSMMGTAPDGSRVEERGISADLLRRQLDGTWRILIDQPRGETPV